MTIWKIFEILIFELFQNFIKDFDIESFGFKDLKFYFFFKTFSFFNIFAEFYCQPKSKSLKLWCYLRYLIWTLGLMKMKTLYLF